jgi:putative Mn2+ efflux pump MntP
MALVCSLLVGITTFVICMAGLEIGKRVGTRLSNKASILGGVILIAIGIEIFVSNVF